MRQKPSIRFCAALFAATFACNAFAANEAAPPPERPKAIPLEKGDTKRIEAAKEIPAERSTAERKKSPVAETSDSKAATPKVNASSSDDEAAIRSTAEAYQKAYCQRDAKSIASMFTPDAEYIDEQGNLFQGREAIETELTRLFANSPECTIAIEIGSIRVISPGVAMEDGVTMFAASDSAEPVFSRYSAVHVKSDGKWLAASVREHAPKDRRQHQVQLQQLNWLRGEWIDESDQSVVVFSCDTAERGNYLLRSFVIQVAGREEMSGKQRIGWDPVSGKLRAWTFDSEGGFNDGYWHRDGDRWILKSSGVTSDGEMASGTSIYTPINDHTMTWQSIDREINGVAQPDSDVIRIVRQSPKPEIAD